MSRNRRNRSRSLAELELEFDANTEQASLLVRPLDRTQLLWRPASGGWSVAECLEHLVKTGTLHLSKLESGIDKASGVANARNHKHRFGFFAWQFMSRMEPPVRYRYKAPRPFRPGKTGELDSAVHHFEENRRRFERLLALAGERRWWKTRVPNPILPGSWLGFGDWLAIIAAHDRRHLRQAEIVTKDDSFPAPARKRRKPIVL